MESREGPQRNRTVKGVHRRVSALAPTGRLESPLCPHQFFYAVFRGIFSDDARATCTLGPMQ